MDNRALAILVSVALFGAVVIGAVTYRSALPEFSSFDYLGRNSSNISSETADQSNPSHI